MIAPGSYNLASILFFRKLWSSSCVTTKGLCRHYWTTR